MFIHVSNIVEHEKMRVEKTKEKAARVLGRGREEVIREEGGGEVNLS